MPIAKCVSDEVNAGLVKNVVKRKGWLRSGQWLLYSLIVIGLVACDGQNKIAPLPTVMRLPTVSPTSLPPSATPTIPLPPTYTFTPSATPTTTATPSATVTDTSTPRDTPTITPTPTVTDTPTPMGDAKVIGQSGVNLRTGPSTRFEPPVALLPPDTELLVAGRSSDSLWYEVRTFDGMHGWVYADLIDLRLELQTVAITWINTPTPVPVVVVVPTANNVAPPPNSGGAGPPPVNLGSRVQQIYQQGRAMGNRATVFSKVGDSITVNQPFFIGFDTGNYDLGSYGYLQDTIDHFKGSFSRGSQAANNAFNAAAVLASMWADPASCQPNEPPLDCEYRINKPSVAIIMLGSVDVQLYDANSFRSYMDAIVQSTISKGIIPVLTTFPNGPTYYVGESQTFNSIIREIAGREQIPLIELRDRAMALPDNGVLDDQYHLSMREDGLIAFTGDQNTWALTLRDFLTLQMLYDIQVGVMR